MAIVALQIRLEASALVAQIGRLKLLLQHLPKRPSKRFARKALALVRKGLRLERIEAVAGATQAPDDRVVESLRVEVAGMDELIAAAARRAAKFDCNRSQSHE